MGELFHKWGDLRIEGYIQGKLVITKHMSGQGVDTKFMFLPDDTELVANGADSTRVVLRVTDEFGAVCPFANNAIKFVVEGPAHMIGDNPFSLIGGTGAIWIRAQESPGTVKVRAIHPYLGAQQIEITIAGSAAEIV
jgi:beta-galactosidase